MGLQEDNARLRELAQGVSRGEVRVEDYRAARRQVIDAWTGETSIDPPRAAERTEPNLPPVESAVTRPGDVPAAADAPKPASGGADLWIGLAVVVLVVLLVAGAMAWFW